MTVANVVTRVNIDDVSISSLSGLCALLVVIHSSAYRDIDETVLE